MINLDGNSPPRRRRDDLVELYGRVTETRLSRELLRGAIAAVDSRLEDDIKREAAAEKEGSCNFQDLSHFRTKGSQNQNQYLAHKIPIQ